MILSWDIGIKNLSYCILSETDSNNQTKKNEETKENIIKFNNQNYIIHKWDVINLVDALEEQKNKNNNPNSNNENTANIITNFNERHKLMCQTNKCKRVGKYCHNENHTLGYCLNCFKKEPLKTNYFFVGHKNPKCVVEGCKRNSTFILNNHHYKSYCTIHQKQLVKKLPQMKTLKMEKKIKATHINLNHLSSILFQELDKLPFLIKSDITTVLLENQPVLKNPTMKSMQMFLYSYFILRSKIDTKNNIKVHCYSANQKNKLVKYLGDEAQFRINDDIKHIKSKYTKNKKEAIMIVENILKDSESKLTEWYASHKKKDDLSDSLLMNIHYCLKNKK